MMFLFALLSVFLSQGYAAPATPSQFVLQTQNINNQIQFTSYFSQGDGYFTPTVANFNQTSSDVVIIPCDFNGDGNTDVVQVWSQSSKVAFASYQSAGNGSYNLIQSNYSQGTGYMTFFALDFTGDGNQDILQTWNDNKKMGFVSYISYGNGTFSDVNTNYSQGYEYMEMFPIDFNGDGKWDVLQTYNNNGNMAFVAYLSLGNGSFQTINTQYDQGRGYISIFAIDLNQDGKQDVLQTWDDKGSMGFVAYISKGDGNFTTVNTFYTTDSSTITIFPSDIDGDGKLDVMQVTDHGRTLNPKVGLIAYISQGDATFKPNEANYQEDSNHISFFPLDIDGDAATDILQTRSDNGQLSFVAYFGLSKVTGFYTTLESVYNATSKYITIFPLNIKHRL